MRSNVKVSDGKKIFHTVVVGVSAGGMDALSRLAAQLPKDFPAPVFVVQHLAPDAKGQALVMAMNREGKLKCTLAENKEKFQQGRIYLAPPGYHMMLTQDRIKLTKGATENKSRPGIDPLFRSAAIAFRNRVIGIVLTGYLDDGTAGMVAIKKCGGTCIVQDPKDAAYPDMPQNVLNQVKTDYCVPLAEMGSLLEKLVQKKPGKNKPIPKDILIEAKIAERVLSDLPSVEALGTQVPFNCPGCGGVLWQIDGGTSLRYRCHVGHAYTAPVLLNEQTAKVEETLWTALRMFEERRNLLQTMTTNNSGGSTKLASERIKQSKEHIDRIRTMLKTNADLSF